MSRRYARRQQESAGPDPAFAPNLQGFTHWYSSRTPGTLGAWTDIISGNNLSQGTAGKRPAVSTIGPNGTVPALSFDGADDDMSPTTPWAIGNGAAYEMYVVLDPGGLPAAATRLIACSRNAASEFVGLGTAGAASQVYVFDKDDVICNSAPRLATLQNGPRCIHSSMTAARLLTARLDGNPVKSATAAAWASGAPNGSFLGSGGAAALFYTGVISELAIRIGTPRSAAAQYATAQYLLSLAYA